MSPDGEELRVWLDDDLVDRAAPEGWVQVTTAREAIELLLTGRVVELSLDQDLGDDEQFGRGVDVVDFIVTEQEVNRRDLWPRDGISLHTANPAGRDAMARTIRRYAAKSGLSVSESRPAASRSSPSTIDVLTTLRDPVWSARPSRAAEGTGPVTPQQPTETSGSRHGATAGIDGGDSSD